MAKSRGRSGLFVVAVAATMLCALLMVASMWLSFGRTQYVFDRTAVAFFADGRAALMVFPPWDSPPDAWHFEKLDFHWALWFRFERSLGIQLAVPLWIPMLITAPIAWRTRPRSNPLGCSACGYDTRNNPTAICPECGHTAAAP